MCRSVPQIPVHSTRILTSLMPGSGSGTFSSHRPRSARLLTKAFIPEFLQENQAVLEAYRSLNVGYSRSARFGPAETGALAFSGLCRGAPSAALGLRLVFSFLKPRRPGDRRRR